MLCDLLEATSTIRETCFHEVDRLLLGLFSVKSVSMLEGKAK